MKTNHFEVRLTALMMAMAMTLFYSCQDECSKINGHAYVELAGMKWATENVGEVEGVKAVATDETYGYYYAQVDDDAKKAAESWGDQWTLPTEAQWQRLITECEWSWTEEYNYRGKTMSGFIVSDISDSSKFIFLPAVGKHHSLGNGVFHQSGKGCYWSAANKWCLCINPSDRHMTDFYDPDNGMAVRPVIKEVIKVDGQINGHDYVEIAGYKWATENVGAVNGVEAGADEVYGYYYSQPNAKKAAASWGGTWTLPSEAIWQALMHNCKWLWVNCYNFNGKTMSGFIASDKNDSSRFIFFPAAGFYFYGFGYAEQGHDGKYWSSDNERFLSFDKGYLDMWGDNGTSLGMAVRLISL